MSKFIWIENTDEGFQVKTSFSSEVITVSMDDHNFVVSCPCPIDHIPFLNRDKLFESIGNIIGGIKEYQNIFRKKTDKEWLIEKMAKSSCKKLYKHYTRQANQRINEMMSKVDKDILTLHKRVFSVLGKTKYSMFRFSQLENYYLIKDMMKSSFIIYFYYENKYIGTGQTINDSIYYKDNQYLKYYSGKSKFFNKTIFSVKKFHETYVDKLFEAETKGTLLRSYDNFNELALFLSSVRYFVFNKKPCNLKKMFAFATKKEIKKSVDIYNRFTHNNLSLRNFTTVNQLVIFLSDMIPNYDFNGKLPEYTRRVCEWHREVLKKKIDNIKDEPVKLPAIPLPQVEGVRLLKTTREIVEEGETMRHCVGGYTRGAVRGDYFIFHVDKYGENATIQVSKKGEVVQSYGPHNKINKASKYAEKLFSKWGSQLKDKPQEENTETIPF